MTEREALEFDTMHVDKPQSFRDKNRDLLFFFFKVNILYKTKHLKERTPALP